MATKVTTATAILMLILFCVRPSLPQTCVVSDCQANVDCDSTEVCFNGKCHNPCQFVTCGLNTICHTTNHSAACSCPIGTVWDPINGCKSLDNPECIDNINCALGEVCLNKKCQDPCKTAFCGVNTECATHNHTAMCFCKSGYIGSPVTGCLQSENCGEIKRFKLFHDKVRTWQEALDHCNSIGMKLATINSQEEQNTVHNLTKDKAVWLGGSVLGNTGNYIWRSTNTTITYTNYFKLSDGDEQHCIIILPNGKWFDNPCGSLYYSICEYYD